VLIKVSGTPGTHGNAMYIDDIRINNANVLSTSKIYNNPHVNLYPNPVNGVAEVSYELAQPGSVTFNVYNMLNQLVYSKTINNQSVGAHAETFNFSDLNSGVYTLSIASGDAISTKKFIKN
jgi:diphthamide biosynthesis methyltransferase